MAWTTPRTWVPGEIVTAAQLNQQLRDNLSFALPNVLPQNIAYNAANWGGFGNSMTWTVDPGDVAWHWIYRVGNRIVFSMGVLTTSIGGTLANALQTLIPGVTAVAMSTVCPCVRFVNGGMNKNILVQTAGGGTIVLLTSDGSNLSSSTNDTLVELTLEMQGI